ncbi:YcnI family copper-binding membrane protein [Marinimicrococcus flavescens]|uniref:DUF1775 domain-containing protein n=1 Tax=Marinimicrococcus flavescens TaxID=3031815 RepID=A0AAP3XRT0_9PROT|nr:DUF1775 domain-containing protein [Marinimicrococcus flavescens]
MRAFIAAAVAAALLPAAADAHVGLETPEAPADSTYKAVFQIGHGCEGTPTTTLRVRIPEGMIAVKPMPKPGWELSIARGDYAKPYDYFGQELTSGVTEVTWSGGSLPDDQYDEFVLRGRLAGFEPGAVVYFPVVQECEKGTHRWIEVPEAGQDPHDLDEPAPALTITEGKSGH